MTTTKGKKVLGNWTVKVQGETVGKVKASDCYRYLVESEYLCYETGERREVRQLIADMIREIRNDELKARREREADDFRETVEAIIESGKARNALILLRERFDETSSEIHA